MASTGQDRPEPFTALELPDTRNRIVADLAVTITASREPFSSAQRAACNVVTVQTVTGCTLTFEGTLCNCCGGTGQNPRNEGVPGRGCPRCLGLGARLTRDGRDARARLQSLWAEALPGGDSIWPTDQAIPVKDAAATAVIINAVAAMPGATACPCLSRPSVP